MLQHSPSLGVIGVGVLRHSPSLGVLGVSVLRHSPSQGGRGNDLSQSWEPLPRLPINKRPLFHCGSNRLGEIAQTSVSEWQSALNETVNDQGTDVYVNGRGGGDGGWGGGGRGGEGVERIFSFFSSGFVVIFFYYLFILVFFLLLFFSFSFFLLFLLFTFVY